LCSVEKPGWGKTVSEMNIGPALIHFYSNSTSAEKLQYFFSHCAAKKINFFDFAPMPALSPAQNQHCRPAEKSQ